MKFRKKYTPILLLFAFLLIVGGFIYMKKYYDVRREGILLTDKHCIVLNDLIRKRTYAFIDTMNVTATGSAESRGSYQDQYYNITKDYVQLEKLWLEEDQEYLNRSEVRFFLPSRVFEGMQLQYRMFQDEYESARKILKKYRREPKFHLRELTSDIVEAGVNLRLAHQGYLIKFQNTPKSEFRDTLITLPDSQCPENNSIFPDIERELGGLVIGP